jgi:hypothetical protein
MNERIKQLAREAGLLAHNPDGPPTKLEKFAELIVQECVAQCEKNKDHEWLGSGSKLSAFNIKEHFGVEE